MGGLVDQLGTLLERKTRHLDKLHVNRNARHEKASVQGQSLDRCVSYKSTNKGLCMACSARLYLDEA